MFKIEGGREIREGVCFVVLHSSPDENQLGPGGGSPLPIKRRRGSGPGCLLLPTGACRRVLL